MRKDNQLNKTLKEGKVALGTWLVTPSATVASVIALSGFDFLIIDCEHGPVSYETAEIIVTAAENEGSTPLIRIHQNNCQEILRGLEIGAHGVIIPQIVTADDAKQVVEAVKYYPQGKRGFSPYTRSAGYNSNNAMKIPETENNNTFIGIIVEGVEGIKNLDEILSVPHINMIYIGLYDLSQSVGKPGDTACAEVKDLLKECARKIKNHGKICGTLAKTEDDIKEFSSMGISFIAYKADSAILNDACLAIKSSFEKITDIK